MGSSINVKLKFENTFGSYFIRMHKQLLVCAIALRRISIAKTTQIKNPHDEVHWICVRQTDNEKASPMV